MIQDAAALPTEEDVHLVTKVDSKDVVQIIEKHNGKRGGLMAILGDIQSKWGFLPKESLAVVAKETGGSLVDIYGVATFYHSFSLKPRGRHLVCACLGTACHVRGARRIADELERQLGIKAGQTTPDEEFTLETVNCLGACALGPVVVVDGHYFSKVKKSRVSQLLDEARKGFDTVELGKDERIFPIEASCPNCNHSLKDEEFLIDGLPSIRLSVSVGPHKGWVRLSSLYGSYNVSTEFDIPEETVTNFVCPHCNSEIHSTSDCSVCEAPMVPMSVDGGAILRICSRRGCKNNTLDLV